MSIEIRGSIRLFGVALLCMVAASFVSAQMTGCKGDQIFTSAKCSGDENSAEERALFEMVRSYRAANNLPELRLSSSLSMVANRRMLDLKQNVKSLTHSWSNCPYDVNDRKSWDCVNESPARLKCGYAGKGYETLFHTIGENVKPAKAMNAWKQSTLHNSIILNLGMFSKVEWDEVGVAIDGQYAALWFGRPSSQAAKNTAQAPAKVPKPRLGKHKSSKSP